MASKGWLTRFDDPIVLDDGTTLTTLRDAIFGPLQFFAGAVLRSVAKAIPQGDTLVRKQQFKAARFLN